MRMSDICVVCEADLSEYIGHPNYGDLYLTCTECGRVVCTYHDGIDWDIGACPKCNKKEEEE